MTDMAEALNDMAMQGGVGLRSNLSWPAGGVEPLLMSRDSRHLEGPPLAAVQTVRHDPAHPSRLVVEVLL